MLPLCLSHHCILGADKMSSSFMHQQMKRNFDLGWFILRVLFISNLDDLDNEICAFHDETLMKL